MIFFSCVNKTDSDQHMQLLSLISIINVRCVDKEVLHAYLLNSLFLDSKILHIDEHVCLGHVWPHTPDNIT